MRSLDSPLHQAAGGSFLPPVEDSPSTRDRARSPRRRGDTKDDAAIELLVKGISCNGCCRKIEKKLGGSHRRDAGRTQLHDAHRAVCSLVPQDITPEEIIAALGEIGFDAMIRPPGKGKTYAECLRRKLLIRLGISAALSMQVMTLSVALYLDDGSGMVAGLDAFFRYCIAFLTTAVMIIGSSVFFAGAARDLRHRRISMDVTVSTALILAYAASVAGLVGLTDEIYFDSIAMFTTLLLFARFIHADQTARALAKLEHLVFEQPLTAHRYQSSDNALVDVPAEHLEAGDWIAVREGEVIPTDGRIIGGAAEIDEGLLTGESLPVLKQTGAEVVGGTVVVNGTLDVDVLRRSGHGAFAEIYQAANRLQAERPKIRQWADRIAGYFLGAVLILASGVAIAGLASGDASWVSRVIAVLIVTCPCALSLATPTALSAAAAALSRRGVIVQRFDALQNLAGVKYAAFDKTGTLTQGSLSLKQIELTDDALATISRTQALEIATAIEHGSNHPIARALRRALRETRRRAPRHTPQSEVSDEDRRQHFRSEPGHGVRAELNGTEYALGSAAWMGALGVRSVWLRAATSDGIATEAWLSSNGVLLARFTFEDAIREESRPCIEELKHRFGITSTILSGDRETHVARVSDLLGIDRASGKHTPAMKSAAVARLGGANRSKVMAIGDGVNDTPMFGQADVSFAIGGHAALAARLADFTVVGDSLRAITDSVHIAKLTQRVTRQNFAWALSYNFAAVPLAAIGVIPPWAAAVGMTVSSLAVTLNAARIR